MKELENKVTNYRQGVDPEETRVSEPETIDNINQPEQVAINVVTEETANQSFHSSQTNLLDKSQEETIEMQNFEQQAQIQQANLPKTGTNN